jgi:hypothetical protein
MGNLDIGDAMGHLDLDQKDFTTRSGEVSDNIHQVCIIITEAAEENNDAGNLVVDTQGNNPRSDATMLVPYFLLFLCFRKVTQEIFSELDETKAEPPIFTEASRRPKMRQRGARSQAHHRGARPSPWPRHPMVRPAGPTSDDALSPIKSPRRGKN